MTTPFPSSPSSKKTFFSPLPPPPTKITPSTSIKGRQSDRIHQSVTQWDLKLKHEPNIFDWQCSFPFGSLMQLSFIFHCVNLSFHLFSYSINLSGTRTCLQHIFHKPIPFPSNYARFVHTSIFLLSFMKTQQPLSYLWCNIWVKNLLSYVFHFRERLFNEKEATGSHGVTQV